MAPVEKYMNHGFCGFVAFTRLSHLDASSTEILGEMVALLGGFRRRYRIRVAVQHGIVLVRLTVHEAISTRSPRCFRSASGQVLCHLPKAAVA